jgi:hypothetical protein
LTFSLAHVLSKTRRLFCPFAAEPETARDFSNAGDSMRTIRWLLPLVLLLCMTPGEVLVSAQSGAPLPEVEAAKPQKPVSLRDRLIVGLRALSPSDVEFVERVVARVNSGRLPQRVVDETFFWARQRAGVKSAGTKARRPIIYFRPAMIAQARRIGVAL